MSYVFNDGGRSKYFKGTGRDCVARSIAIASGIDYKEIYNLLAEGNSRQKKVKKGQAKKTALYGVDTKQHWFKFLMHNLGFEWIPTMKVGQGCKVHLRSDELPKGRIICRVTKHYTAVIDGVINDTYDCSRNGTRCVYGYWVFDESNFGINPYKKEE